MGRGMAGGQDLAISGLSGQIPSTRPFTSLNSCSVNEGKKERENAQIRAGFCARVMTVDEDLSLGGSVLESLNTMQALGFCSCACKLCARTMVMLGQLLGFVLMHFERPLSIYQLTVV